MFITLLLINILNTNCDTKIAVEEKDASTLTDNTTNNLAKEVIKEESNTNEVSFLETPSKTKTKTGPNKQLVKQAKQQVLKLAKKTAKNPVKKSGKKNVQKAKSQKKKSVAKPKQTEIQRLGTVARTTRVFVRRPKITIDAALLANYANILRLKIARVITFVDVLLNVYSTSTHLQNSLDTPTVALGRPQKKGPQKVLALKNALQTFSLNLPEKLAKNPTKAEGELMAIVNKISAISNKIANKNKQILSTGLFSSPTLIGKRVVAKNTKTASKPVAAKKVVAKKSVAPKK